ncbi:MAG: extracellular solute-binding protein [Lachnospiraceae bacterium]|nr:extracellular solute-binding protein [Lachnospiraceae bacterium]
MIRYSKKLVLPFVLTVSLILTSCGMSGNNEKAGSEKVKLELWCDDSSLELLQESLGEFEELHKDEAQFEFSYGTESEISCKKTVLADIDSAADIFVFADDQFDDLYNGGALLEITENADEVIAAVGGPETGAAKSSMRDGKLYAYPETAGNGYFLYYNSDYLSDEDVKSLDRILEVAGENGKKFSMQIAEGWYLYSFFKGGGLDITYDNKAKKNICNWNATDTPVKGVDVVESLLKYTTDPAFLSTTDDGFVSGVKDGSIIAGVNGPWNAEAVEGVWGDKMKATKLPEFDLKGTPAQMCSFTGYKLAGVNARTKEPHWAMELAKFITSKDIQLKRFKMVGDCPANVEAASSEEVKASPAVAALAMQAKFGYTQDVGDPFWDAAALLGTSIAAGNPDNRDIQELLDTAVEEIEAPVADEEGSDQ